ncbi:unnamed protein product [Heterobilharzia americana]|nr:unnamed protein product [Heterobilharzia americana]
MNKVKQLVEELQSEKDEGRIITKLLEIYQVYSHKQNKNYEALNIYLLNSILPPLLCNCMKQNFSQFNDNWTASYQLSCFILEIITFSYQTTNITILNDLQNNIIESHLILLKRLQKYYLMSSSDSLIKMETPREECLDLIQSLLTNLQKLIRHFQTIPHLLFKSPWFLQLFISDNQEFFILLVELFTTCIDLSPESFRQLKHSLRIDILDEIIYHLSIVDISKGVESILRCLFVLLSSIPELCTTIQKRYRGIQLLLMKWVDQFTSESTENKHENCHKNDTCRKLLDQIIKLINEYKLPVRENETVHGKEQFGKVKMNLDQAVITIQSFWRGYSDRKKLKHVNKNIGRFQKNFRERQLKKTNDLQRVKLEKELQHTINMSRHKRYREKLESEMKLWSSLPPQLVEVAWNKQREEAAISIQRHYRGYSTRKSIKSQHDYLKRDKAARIIQSYFRRHLSRLECLSTRKYIFPLHSLDNNIMKKESKLIDSKFLEIIKDEEVHKETQIKLEKYLHSRRISNIKNQARQVTFTRMKIDSDLLLNEVIEEDKRIEQNKTITPRQL